MSDVEPINPVVFAINTVTSIIYLLIAVVLIILAFFSFYDVGIELMQLFSNPDISSGVLQVLHALLVTIILIEILETVTVYFKTKSLLVRPILIAGLTAMIRKVLIFGVDTTRPEEVVLTLAAIVVLTFSIIFIGKEEIQS